MKKTLLFSLLLSACSFHLSAQDKILFNVHYTPEKSYDQVVDQSYLMTLTYSGSKEFLQKLKEKGVDNPTIKNTQSVMKASLKTGKQTADQFPFTMEFVETTSSDNKKVIPDGTLIYGHCVVDKMPAVDSLSAKDMDEEVKKAMLPILQSFLSQISYPKKEVKVGESFSDKTPLSIPLGGMSLDMEIKTVYKLLSVQNGLANFNIQQVYTMKTSSDSQYKITATGSGKGSMVYDIKANYFTHCDLDNTMQMHMKTEQFNLDLEMTNKNSQEVKVSDNK